ncbi:uncharacterized protein BCR38DRAFT_413088 [Pseudomassariella vexata]|uniref:T6SS Phospholipase effector Tle1-like catalytic domain-containing protein n=1 Tax=Pseudomassariella vexata TaxID=1141098 RepID=A0A1Y2DHQ7_9PEZI|nr:uncharacterized protein BCR38DRAFT_413088 [Pseudomassariella vexata]ORY58769.1 hypothetical protein BCR38DRAFT_413088 [Pseudomassariella vexata]
MLKTKRFHAGAFGHRALTQIKEVYRECCRLDGPEEEVWLYGFSRGAFVIRAVADILHYITTLTSAHLSSFNNDYNVAFNAYKRLQRQDNFGEDQIYNMFAANTRAAPTIQFVGALDTVKAVDDDCFLRLIFQPFYSTYETCTGAQRAQESDAARVHLSEFPQQDKMFAMKMHDIRRVHKYPGHHGTRYAVQLYKMRATLWPKENPPQGVILHPSVDFVFDEHLNVYLDVAHFPLRTLLEQWR